MNKWIPVFSVAPVLVVAAAILYARNDAQQRERNLQELLNTNSTEREKIEAKYAAQKTHDEFVHWGATNGVPEYQFEYGTNLLGDHRLRDIYSSWLTNGEMDSALKDGIIWIQKSAVQGYRPAVDALTNFPDATRLLGLE